MAVRPFKFYPICELRISRVSKIYFVFFAFAVPAFARVLGLAVDFAFVVAVVLELDLLVVVTFAFAVTFSFLGAEAVREVFLTLADFAVAEVVFRDLEAGVLLAEVERFVGATFLDSRLLLSIWFSI